MGAFGEWGVLWCSARHLFTMSAPTTGLRKAQGTLQEARSLLVWYAKGSAGLRERVPQRAWASYTQFSLLNPELPTQMVGKVGPEGATPLPGCRMLEDGDCWAAGGLGLPASCQRRSLAPAAREGAGERSPPAGRPRSPSRTPDYFPLNNNNNNNCSPPPPPSAPSLP